MTNIELLDLLREAREFVDLCALSSGFPHIHKTLDRIDAALAEGCPDCGHQYGQQEYCQGDGHAEHADSATPVVEWRLGDDCDEDFVYYEAYPDSDTGVDAVRFKDGKWRWTMSREQQGYCDTLDEAKSAAIRAARGLK